MFETVTFLFMSFKENSLILMKIRLFVSGNSINMEVVGSNPGKSH